MPQSENVDDTVLTDLCAICHVNPIKYTCPRCSLHTCSLSCVKKHKQWAQCSGIRNPAEYRKRAELATPSSVDKDFNFISSVERSLQRADVNLADRGIDLTPARPRLSHHRVKPILEQEVESRNITIIRAPKALARSRANKTHWAGALKCIIWTVEWVLHHGEKKAGGVHESKTIEDAFVGIFGKRSLLKRKRTEQDTEEAQDSRANKAPESIGPDTAQDREMASQPILSPDGLSIPHESRSSVFFYLHHPNTEARYKVLIPIQASDILKEVLCNRVLVEFPTIFVLLDSPANLQAPYMGVDEYNRRHGQDIPINIVPSSSPVQTQFQDDAEEGEVAGAGVDVTNVVDEARVLEVLAKDIGD